MLFCVRLYSYQCFPPLDPTLFLSPISLSNSPYNKTLGLTRTTSQSVTSFVAIRTQAEKTKNKNVSSLIPIVG